MERLLAYCPLWSPLQAYYRLGYGWGGSWYWDETATAEHNHVDGAWEGTASAWSQDGSNTAAN